MWVLNSVSSVGTAFLTNLKVEIYEGFTGGWAKFQKGDLKNRDWTPLPNMDFR